ncbi:hypothetical protein FA95DRAFT_899429 [Auriscalpium vulgare]|uniref:Uncharacterized protein n=1 Tax=Auriscalpium vulgare TaxID=40419 RepID=A0ACB8R873_9AGAM|nr:hypothetical protein FA95DRAFT_899429 [Auriscalpium vulgare]
MSQDLPDGELSLESATNSGQSSTLGLTLISLSSTPEPTPVDSGAPYDDTDADLILRSSDLVDFRVYKVVLAKASPVFKVLLSGSPKSDAKTPSIALSGESKDGCSVICLPENKDVLESLLSAILPVPVVIPGNLNRLLPILAAAQKYNMNAALASLRSTTSHVGVVDKTPEDAFRTYCHAQQLGLLEESIKAAKATLPRKLSIESLGSDLRLATGPALDKLHRFHTSIAQRANVSLRTVLVASQTMWVADAASKKTRCRETTAGPLTHDIPYWFAQFVLRNIHDDFPAPPSYTSFLLALVLHCHKGFCRYCTSLSASFLEKVWGDLSACISAPVTLVRHCISSQQSDE